jgi:hypothetical protein
MANNLASGLHPDEIRMATPDEIPRVGFVAAAGFYHSPANQFERPGRNAFPKHTLLHYQWQMRRCLYDENCVLFVAEDEFEENEDDGVYQALREICQGEKWPVEDGKVVVGFVCLTLKKGSARKGKYQPPGEIR